MHTLCQRGLTNLAGFLVNLLTQASKDSTLLASIQKEKRFAKLMFDYTTFHTLSLIIVVLLSLVITNEVQVVGVPRVAE
jgi:hypothetical protein